MPFEIRAWKFLFPVVGALFLVAACSSSDAPAPAVPVTQPTLTHERLSAFFQAASAGAPNIARQTAIAATGSEALPESPNGSVDESRASRIFVGGVTQSSNPSHPAVNVDIPLPGSSQFFVANIPGHDHGGLLNTPTGTGTFTVPSLDADGNTTATLHLWINRDTPNSVGGENNYLAYGFWILDPVGTTTGVLPSIGAFVDGNDQSPEAAGAAGADAIAFPFSSFELLRGTATYAGGAEGLYHEEIPVADGGSPVPRFAAWTASASLTATFDQLAAGMINGTISNFVGLPEDVPISTVALTSTLPRQPADGAFFAGDNQATATVNIAGTPVDFTGDWGGKFYDDVGAPGTMDVNDYPGTVAGTFGLADTATADTYRAFLGIFYADLEE